MNAIRRRGARAGTGGTAAAIIPRERTIPQNITKRTTKMQWFTPHGCVAGRCGTRARGFVGDLWHPLRWNGDGTGKRDLSGTTATTGARSLPHALVAEKLVQLQNGKTTVRYLCTFKMRRIVYCRDRCVERRRCPSICGGRRLQVTAKRKTNRRRLVGWWWAQPHGRDWSKRARRIMVDEHDDHPNAAQCRTDKVRQCQSPGGRRASRCTAASCASVRQRSLGVGKPHTRYPV